MHQLQGQHLFQNQKIIQDQNYSHNILYMLLSSIQSLRLAFLNRLQQDFDSKVFSSVDVVDYRNKNIAQLKSQLSMHLHLFRTSKMVFEQDNPGVQWMLPNNLSIEQIRAFIMNCCQAFQNDHQALSLAQTTFEVLANNLSDLYIDHHNFAVNYSETERTKNQKSFVANGISAGNQMERVRNELEEKNIQDASELTAPFDMQDPMFNNPPQNQPIGNESPSLPQQSDPEQPTLQQSSLPLAPEQELVPSEQPQS